MDASLPKCAPALGEVLLNLWSLIAAAAGRDGEGGFVLVGEAGGCCCGARSSARSGGSMEERGSKTAMATVSLAHAATLKLESSICATFEESPEHQPEIQDSRGYLMVNEHCYILCGQIKFYDPEK